MSNLGASGEGKQIKNQAKPLSKKRGTLAS